MTEEINKADGIAAIMREARRQADELGRAELRTVTLEGGDLVRVAIRPGGALDIINESNINPHRARPLHRRGTARMTSLDSFIEHVNRFGDEDTAIFADDSRTQPGLMAVLDYHRADRLAMEEDETEGTRIVGEFRHGFHRTFFGFPLSDEWKAWQAGDGSAMGMSDFARFLEDRIGDIALVEDDIPESAERFVETNGGKKMIADYSTLHSLSLSLRINEKGTVAEARTLATGEGSLRVSVEHDTQIGDITIKVPTMFFIAIPVFQHGHIYRLPVRLRYRSSSTGVVFWYDIWRDDLAFDDAFRDAIARVRREAVGTVFIGSPEV